MSYRVKFTTSLDNELKKKIKMQALREERSVSAILNDLIWEYLRQKASET